MLNHKLTLPEGILLLERLLNQTLLSMRRILKASPRRSTRTLPSMESCLGC